MRDTRRALFAGARAAAKRAAKLKAQSAGGAVAIVAPALATPARQARHQALERVVRVPARRRDPPRLGHSQALWLHTPSRAVATLKGLALRLTPLHDFGLGARRADLEAHKGAHGHRLLRRRRAGLSIGHRPQSRLAVSRHNGVKSRLLQ